MKRTIGVAVVIAGIAAAAIGIGYVFFVIQPAQSQQQQQERHQQERNTETLKAQDPAFNQYITTARQCMADRHAQGTVQSSDVTACQITIQSGVDRWCDIGNADYHVTKCHEATALQEAYGMGR